MPQIIIDGQRIEAAAGKTIIEAALDSSMTIPHFCWHPGLSVAGNCRMCLVNVGFPKKGADGSPEFDTQGNPVVQWGPKLSIACATPVADGMIIDTQGQRTEHAQEAIMEFLLINHPLDCPICDEAGQCKLQEYAFRHSNGKSRFIEQKVHKDKRVSLGPNVLFDGERCISCSRCIRFAEEVAKQPALTFVQRGDHVTIQTFPGMEFDSAYSMNVIDICPVGALTSIDFRFHARVWEMSFTDSVCPGCARGCNIKIGVRNNEVLRIEPRTNMHVNEYWMCDAGRLENYAPVNEGRITGPIVHGSSADWATAYKAAADILKKYKPSEIMVLGSANATNEDIYATVHFARTVLKTHNIDFLNHRDPAFADEFLRVADRNANTAGALELGLRPADHGANAELLADRIRKHQIKVLFVINEDILAGADPGHVDHIIVHASNHNKTTAAASVVFAGSTFAEVQGTFTNLNRRVQLIEPAIATKENERYMGMRMSRWDKLGSHNDRWSQGERRNCRPAWKNLSLLAAEFGAKWNFRDAQDVFAHIVQETPAFHNMSYELLEEYQGLVLGKAKNPEPKAVIYESHTLKPQI
jgi:NADH-quinone oxidoreductase subunit G